MALRPTRTRLTRYGILSIALLTAMASDLAAQDAATPPQDPAAGATESTPRKPERSRWSWDTAAAEVSPTGDLVWKPLPFHFEAGKSVRYIDFDAGDDANDGATKAKPWKHHPWDPAAQGQSRASTGTQTYVFKRGVVYRGSLRPRESGSEGDPIRLTSDPTWGKGEAILSGAEVITGWQRGADRAEIPDRQKVWYVDLPFAPRNLWQATKSDITRIPLARTPNWKETDPQEVRSEWWTWDQPEWWAGKNQITFQGHKAHIGIDPKHLTQPADYYIGATLRTEYGIVMGTPFPTRVEGFDAARKGLIFQGIWFGDSEKILPSNHYYLEDKPQFLDSPGEFWFDKKGEGGRLYLRLPNDADPNTACIEAGRHVSIIESTGIDHVAITGLTFRFTNTYWDLTLAGWGNPDVANAAIRIRGAADDVKISNCRFEQIAGKGIMIDPSGKRVDHIAITDNEILYTDHGAMQIIVRGPGDVQVLRNRLYMIGARPHRQDHGHALSVEFPATMEIAGNIMDRCYGAGIFVFGGKASGDGRDVPLSRVLVHHNRAVDTLLAANDWGGIETWQGGPQYVYDNISGNPNGRWWGYQKDKPGSARLGLAYYHDGGFKVYNFNNVAWGNPVEATSPLRCYAAYYEATPTIENTFFNNTAFAFHVGSNWSPAGGRHYMLGNLWLDISGPVFQHGQLKEDKAAAANEYPYDSVAISRNVFSSTTGPVFGLFESTGKGYANLASMQAAMQGRKPLAGDVGVMTDRSPVRNAVKHDFRPLPGSAAIDRGVKVFVPWALSRCVGEWHFRRDNGDPAILLDSHWYLAPYYGQREDYHNIPTYPLKGVGITAADFMAGPLEDWVDGSLKLNGKDQYAVLTQAEMSRPVTYSTEKNGKRVRSTAERADLFTPDITTGNLLIEAYLQINPGQAAGLLVSKLADSGYQLALNRTGGVTFELRAGGQAAQLESKVRINDGKWHHVIAEVDRKSASGAIYIDGNKVAADAMQLPAGSSLSNDADLLVGGGPQQPCLAGSLEFLRIAQGTLADAHTSIEELYDWEFDGPFLRDFAGREPTGKARDAGAFEAVKD